MRVLHFLAFVFCAAGLSALAGGLLWSFERSSAPGIDSEAARLDRDRVQLERRLLGYADAYEPITWALFDRNQTKYAGRRVILRNSDFGQGTLVVRESAVLQLAENVTFAPNPDIDFRVRRPSQNARYPERSGFALGFFATLAITAKTGVLFDGYGYWMTQDMLMANFLRFHGHIHLASSQFIPNQGPLPIGEDEHEFSAAENVIVRNVNLGRTSHFGLAADGTKNVHVHDVRFVDYEVSAFKLNGVKDVHLRNVVADGHFIHVAINGEFNSALFVLEFMEQVPVTERSSGFAFAYDRLKALVDDTKSDLRALGSIDKATHPEAASLFSSASGMLTGSTVTGGLITDLGVSVGPIQVVHDHERASKRVVLQNVRINNTRSHTVEAIGIVDQYNKFVTGVAGAVFDLVRVRNQYGSLGADPLVVAELEYAAWYNDHPNTAVRTARPRVPAVFIDWVRSSGGSLGADGGFAEFLEASGYRVVGNLDLQAHVVKKSFAFRVQSSEDVYIDDMDLGDSLSSGDAPFSGGADWIGYDIDPKTYSAETHGHPDMAPQVGYTGCDMCAFMQSSSINVQLRNVRSGSVRTTCGSGFGEATGYCSMQSLEL